MNASRLTTTTVPEWCGTGTEASIPSSDLIHGGPVQDSAIGTYEFITTAGDDRLTANAGRATRTLGAAMSMKAMALALAGLGAAVAVFL